jgi:hypothetical protein
LGAPTLESFLISATPRECKPDIFSWQAWKNVAPAQGSV